MDVLSNVLFAEFLGKSAWLWMLFFSIVILLLAFDLGILNRDQHEISVKESLWLSAFYIAAAALFGGWVWHHLGPESGLNFFTGYFIEKSLSLDNVFVIALVFAFFAIPRRYQHRVLFWGILGVIVLRGLMIGVGAALIHEFSWILYIFAAFLLITGIKMLVVTDHEPNIADNPLLRLLRRRLRVTEDLADGHFWVRRPDPATGHMVRYATPLFLALCLVEFADLIFAVDSVPAIFAITTDPYIVYTSNIFAVLGLRSLYFALAAMIHRFAYLKYALALVLIFIGAKIFYSHLVGKVDPLISLGVTFALLIGGVVLSLLRTRKHGDTSHDDAEITDKARQARPSA